jgi:hypothetical protein
MDFSLFFAWQSDRPLDDNKHLIRDAAKEAVKRVSADADVEESPRLDHDTKGLSGTPEVASSIFTKIERTGMFLGDVTYVGSSLSFDGREKKLPNMNVAIELGYAGKAVGWERIILVMNKAYGDADEQVFDIKHRRNPITFDMPADGGPDRRREERKKLSKAIEEAVRARLKCEHEGVKEIISVLDQHCLEVMVTFSPHPSFAGPAITEKGKALAAQAMLHALSRMLELRLLRCDPNYNSATSTAQYGYHWTYLGRLAARHLGIIE